MRAAGARSGVRVRIFPQPYFLVGDRPPVTVTLAPPAGSVGPGPACDRMYALHAIGKPAPYGLVEDASGRTRPFLPPWRGPVLPPPAPDAAGHFDWLEPSDPRFPQVHAWACARFTLDVWQGWLGPVPWHFQPVYPRLEIVCIDDWDNGQAGFGYLELGWNHSFRGRSHAFALNFDTVAHEVGHLLLFALLGVPPPQLLDGEFRGFHEAMADVVALLAAASLPPVVADVLERTRGNLYVSNELGRFAELSPSDQLREAANGVTLDQFRDGWVDEHDLALPLLGAFFDILVEIYQTRLVEWAIVPAWILDLADDPERAQAFAHPVDEAFDRAWKRSPLPFFRALAEACEITGRIVAGTLRTLSRTRISYAAVAVAAMQVERRLTGGRFARALRQSFDWRGIGRIRVGPQLRPVPARSHLSSARGFVPAAVPLQPTG